MKKLSLAAGALLLAGSSLVFANGFDSYETVLTTPVQAGNVELNAGAYHIWHRGNRVYFHDLNTDRVYRVAATVEKVGQRNEAQTVTINNGQLQSVELGGHRVNIQFAAPTE